MEIKKIADLRNKMEGQLYALKEKYNTCNIKNTVTWGTKNSTVKFYYITDKLYKHHYGSINFNLEAGSNLTFTLSGQANSPVSLFPDGVDNILTDVYKVIIEFILGYQKFKGYKRLILLAYGKENNPYEYHIERAMSSFKLKPYFASDVLSSHVTYSSQTKIFLNLEEEKEMENIYFLEKQIKEALFLEPTFVRTNGTNKTYAPFGFNFQFYNSIFRFKLAGNKLRMVEKDSDLVMLEGELKDGVVQEMLEQLFEENKIQQLIKPTFTHTKEFFKEYLNVISDLKLVDDDIEKFVMLHDEKTEIGQTERLSKLIMDIADNQKYDPKDYGEKKSNQMNKLSFKKEESKIIQDKYPDNFKGYKIQVGDTYWFILISIGSREVYYYSNDNEIIPQELHEKCDEIVRLRHDINKMKELYHALNILKNNIGKMQNKKINDYLYNNRIEDLEKTLKQEFGTGWKKIVEKL